MSNEQQLDITATVSRSVADALMARAGIAQDARGRFSVPEEAQPFIGMDLVWERDEAFMVALVILAANEEL